jgi:hypothetical protein
MIETVSHLAREMRPDAEEEALRRRVADTLHLPPQQLVPELSALLGWETSEFRAEVAMSLPPALFPEVKGS